MCGIAGAINRNLAPWVEPLVGEIVRSQIPRGPDHQAVEVVSVPHGHCVLGHNRLSIIDLSVAGNQPMWDSERRFALVFNGEIYNYIEIREELLKLGHSFVSQSDSEVLIEAYKEWGDLAVERFNGMFAFALLDTKLAELTLCRDRFGVKPCYFHVHNGGIVFASTTKSIASHFKLQPNLEYVASGLRYLVYENSTDRTQYHGLRSLRPGHILKVRIRPNEISVKETPYYDLRSRVSQLADSLRGSTEANLVARVQTLLTDAVRLRTRADVKVGISLSGGLDSSSIAGILSGGHDAVQGFSFASPSSPESEGRFVEQVIKKTGVRVEYIWPNSTEMISSLSDVLETQDAPFPTGSIIAQNWIFRRARELGFKVLMGGQGADEGYMGYRKYQLFDLQRSLLDRRWAESLRSAFWIAPMIISEAFQFQKYINSFHRYFGNRSTPADALALPDSPSISLSLGKDQSLAERQILDLTEYSLPTLLRYEDRNSMGNSIESRLPFVDYRVVELGVALPASLKVRAGFGKWAVRQAVADVVPDSIRKTRFKLGFNATDDAWVDAGLGNLLRKELKPHETRLVQFLRGGSIENLFSDSNLKARPTAFKEAISLIWLGRRLS